MSNERETQAQLQVAGGCFTVLIGILFIVLKLTGAITWSWLWVLCPFWIGIALSAIIWVVIGLCVLLSIMIVAANNKGNGWR